MGDLQREVWEGWTPQDFIDALSEIHFIMHGAAWRKPFTTKKELAKYIVNNQPYYKKPIPEVIDHFANMYGLE